MNRKFALRLLSLAALGPCFATTGFAQAAEGGYFYGGGSIGQSRAKIDTERINANLLGAGLSTTSMSTDERDTAYKLFGGYQFNRHFGLEGGYFNLGRFGFNSTTSPAGTLNGEMKVQGVNLDLVGTWPLSARWSALGRVGAQYASTRDSFSSTGAVSVRDANPSKRELNYKLGVGMQYEVSPSFLVRAEAERFRINDAVGNHGDVNMFSVGLVFPFGRAAEPVRPMAAAPAPYVAPPPPAPVVVAAAPPAAVVVAPRRKVRFEAETLFTFDQSDLRPEGKAALDTFARELKGSQFEVITVIGHADRLGSTAYNQTLSAQRAEVVKAYLVSSAGIDPAKVSASGKSESAPVTEPADCKGDKPTAKLIACLQPDRGVEIEVVGSR
ncbi:MAG: OmpA family protein [Rhizobacter sp.]|nr:OmpA family protein [Rhizobacter sp.]